MAQPWRSQVFRMKLQRCLSFDHHKSQILQSSPRLIDAGMETVPIKRYALVDLAHTHPAEAGKEASSHGLGKGGELRTQDSI